MASLSKKGSPRFMRSPHSHPIPKRAETNFLRRSVNAIACRNIYLGLCSTINCRALAAASRTALVSSFVAFCRDRTAWRANPVLPGPITLPKKPSTMFWRRKEPDSCHSLEPIFKAKVQALCPKISRLKSELRMGCAHQLSRWKLGGV